MNISWTLFTNYWWISPRAMQRRYSPTVREQSLWTVQMYSNVYGSVRGVGAAGGMRGSPRPHLQLCLTGNCTSVNISQTKFANYWWISPQETGEVYTMNYRRQELASGVSAKGSFMSVIHGAVHHELSPASTSLSARGPLCLPSAEKLFSFFLPTPATARSRPEA